MRGLIILVSSLAVASCSPTVGLLKGILGGGSHVLGGGGHVLGGAGHGVGLGGGLNPASAVLGLTGGAGNPAGVVLNTAKGILGAAGGLGGNADKGYLKRGFVYPVGGGGLLQALGFLGQGLSDVFGNLRSIFGDIVHLRIPGIIDDGFNAISSVSRAAGGIINAVIPGLGSLLGNIVISFAKILTCILGSPGLTGGILGDRRPGRDNPVDIPAICRNDWGKKYGWNYSGKYNSPGQIISYYKVGKAKWQALQLINKYTKGRGLNGLTVQERIVCERIIIIAEIFDRDSSTWSDKDIRTLSINVIIVVSVLGDSYQSGLGGKIANEWIAFLKKNNKNKRFPDLSPYRHEIYRAIKNIKHYKWNGAFRDTKERYNGDQSDINDQVNSSSNDNDSNGRNVDNNSDESDSYNDSDRNSNDSRKKDSSYNSNSKDSNDSNNDSYNRNAGNRHNSESSNNNSNSNDSNDNNNDSYNRNAGNRHNSESSNNNSNTNDSNDSSNDSSNRNVDKRHYSGSSNSDSNTNDSNDSSNDSSNRNVDKRHYSGSSNSDSNTNDAYDSSNDSSNRNVDKRHYSGSSNSDSNTNLHHSNSNSSNDRDSNDSNNNDGNDNNSGNSDDDNVNDRSRIVKGGRSTDYRKRAASNNEAHNTDESSNNKSSEGSGRSVKNADGSFETEYNFKNVESDSKKKTSDVTDARSLEESYKTQDC